MHYLYRYYDKDKNLLYVGVCNNLERRFSQHSGTEWAALVSSSSIKKFKDRKIAMAEEKIAIKTEKPLYNIVHTNKFSEIRKSKDPKIFLLATRVNGTLNKKVSDAAQREGFSNSLWLRKLVTLALRESK